MSKPKAKTTSEIKTGTTKIIDQTQPSTSQLSTTSSPDTTTLTSPGKPNEVKVNLSESKVNDGTTSNDASTTVQTNDATIEKTTTAGVTSDEVKNSTITTADATNVKEFGKLVKNDVITTIAPESIVLIQATTELKLAAAAAGSLTARPLFSFEMPSGSTTFSFEPRDTPFMVIANPPRFFELKTLMNGNQDPNESGVKIHGDLNNIDQIVKSRELFNEATMTVRVVPLETINGITIGNPNTISEGVVKVQQVQSVYETFQSYASLLECRLMYIINVFRATDSILHLLPKRKVVNKILGETPVHSALSQFAFFENDYPHIYFSIFFSATPWFVSAIANLYQEAPIRLGECNTVTWQNKKISARVRAVTDQYSTAIANLTIERLKASQLNVQEYINRCQANMFPLDIVRVRSSYNPEVTSLLYSPSNTEWQLVMALIMCNARIRHALFSQYCELYSATNRLSTFSLEEVWNSQNSPTDPIGQQVYQTFLSRMAVGDRHSPYQLLLIETFAPWFDIHLSFPALPPDYGAVIEIMSILFFVNTFPQIAQQTANQWGYRMNELLSAYLPKQHNAWLNAYGEIRHNNETVSLDGRQMTKNMSQQGYIYSIFDNVRARPSTVTKAYYDFIAQMRNLCIPMSEEVHLVRKKIARYPYYAEDYNAYTSWEQVIVGDYAGQPRTPWVQRLLAIVDLVEGITQLRTISGNMRDTLQRSTLSFINTYYSNIKSLLNSAALPFQSTLYRMQNTIMNSFAFVYQRYDPKRPFNVPTNLVLSPAKLDTTAMGVPIQANRIMDLDLFIAARLLLTLDGDFKRNIKLTSRGVPQSVDSLPQPSQGYTMLQGNQFDRLAMGLVPAARRFGVAMEVTKWLTDPDNPKNPLQPIADGFAYIMQMSNWVPLVKQVFTAFGLSFEDYYLDIFGPATGTFDGRTVILQIRELDPATQKPTTDPRVGTIFGREIQYIDSYIMRHMRILTVPFLNALSPILNTIMGLYVGKFLVSELTPQQLNLEHQWEQIEVLVKAEEGVTRNVTWILVPMKDGQAYAMQVKRNNTVETYYLPYDPRMPKLMLVMESFSQIPLTHKEGVAKCIHYGSLALKVYKVRTSVTLEDKPSRTIDYSKESTIAELQRIISTPDGELIGTSMVTTTYATNFTMNAQTIPVYIQWVATIEQADKNLHAAVLNSGPLPKEQTKLPSPYELEYGLALDDISLAFRDGTRKTDSNIINWNNEYEAIGQELIDTNITLDYVPSQPMSYNQFKY